MNLVQPEERHLLEMMDWFKSERDLTEWAGPGFRFPFNQQSFREDLKLDELSSYSLVSESERFLAFGQYYERLGRCHLGRLAVSPVGRGRGVARQLIAQLCAKGMDQLDADECSLFVMQQNTSAIRAYKKSGFDFSTYPDGVGIEDCLYMVRQQVKAGS